MSRPPPRTVDLGRTLLNGRSASWRQVRRLVEMAAPTAANVLILGEPGTGKEYVAQAVHALSPQRDGPLLTLQCGALTSEEWLAELFGRGAAKGRGLLAQAQHGTLFLNDVGTMALVVQDRLTAEACKDVRLFVAAAGPLGAVMREQRFGGDLFFRLRLFPITVPSLSKCLEALPDLVWHLTRFYAAKYKRKIDRIPPETLRAMARWRWPGNLPELEEFVHRSVQLTAGRTLAAPIAELASPVAAPTERSTLEEVEREHILRTLRACRGVITNAATRLGLPRTTLNARIKKLGISREEI